MKYVSVISEKTTAVKNQVLSMLIYQHFIFPLMENYALFSIIVLFRRILVSYFISLKVYCRDNALNHSSSPSLSYSFNK